MVHFSCRNYLYRVIYTIPYYSFSIHGIYSDNPHLTCIGVLIPDLCLVSFYLATLVRGLSILLIFFNEPALGCVDYSVIISSNIFLHHTISSLFLESQ